MADPARLSGVRRGGADDVVSLPPLGNPWTRVRAWVRANRAQAEIAAIAGVAIGLIVIMFVITLVIIFRTLR